MAVGKRGTMEKRGRARTVFAPSSMIVTLGADVTTVSPQDTNPFFSEFDLSIPRDLSVLNRLIDYYATFHPLIANSMDLHAEISWSDFSLQCEDPSIGKDYEDMVEELNLKELLWGCYHEWFKFGESIMLGAWDDDDRIWREYFPIPMHKMRIEKMFDPTINHSKTMYYYHVTPEDRRKMEAFANTGGSFHYSPDYVSYDLSTNFLEAYMNYGDIIPVHDFYVFRVKRVSNNYDLRGRSMVLRCLKDALLEDYLIRAQMRVARDRVRAPDVWLIGDKEAPPDDDELDAWRGLIEKQANDPNYQIVAAPPMELRNYSTNLRLLQMEPEIRRIEERMALALWTTMEGLKNYQAASTYAGASTLQQVRESRYMTYRKILEDQLIKKVFMPVAVARKYVKKKEGEKQLVLPGIINPSRSKYEQDMTVMPNNISYEEAFKNSNYDGVEKQFIIGSDITKIAKEVSKRDLDLPEIILRDRIRLQDATEKVRALSAFAGDYPIPFKTICDLIGVDYTRIKEDLDTVKDDELWKPPILREQPAGAPQAKRPPINIPGAGMGGGEGMPPVGGRPGGLPGGGVPTKPEPPPIVPGGAGVPTPGGGLPAPGKGERGTPGGVPPVIPQKPIGGL